MKYTETLKEDLRNSWKDNKVLENQISELKVLLKAKEQELVMQLGKIQDLNLDDMKPLADFEKLSNETESLKNEIENLKTTGHQVIKFLSNYHLYIH
jgi:chromosome segregation ATPase